ncbi:MAG: hypothetical protein P8123_04290, partial [bacterium]
GDDECGNGGAVEWGCIFNPLEAGMPFTLHITVNQNITQPFDFYLIADTSAGPYTLYLNGNAKKGITPLYRNVPSLDAPFSTTVRSAFSIPASMQGKTVTFYAAVIQSGKIPPVKRLSDLTPETLYVFMMDKNVVTVGP